MKEASAAGYLRQTPQLVSRPSCRPRSYALSLVEMVIAAFIIGVTAIPIVDLIRSSTESLEITETEAAARGLAADILERFSSAPVVWDRKISDQIKTLLNAPVRWDLLFTQDPWLLSGFPINELRPVLDASDARVTLQIEHPFNLSHPGMGTTTGMDCYRVTVSWKDREDRRKEVTLATLQEQ